MFDTLLSEAMRGAEVNPGEDGIYIIGLKQEEIANMTRKDYIAIAAAFKAQQPVSTCDADKHAQYTQDVCAVADVLAADNPRFDYGRFYAAAGFVQKSPGEL